MRSKAHTKQFTNRVIVIFAIGVFFLACVGFLSYKNAEREEEQRGWVSHTYQVLVVISAVENNVLEAEGRQRNYLLTGQAGRLQGYHESLQGLSASLSQLRGLTMDDPAQQKNVDALESLIASKALRLQTGIDMRDQRGLAASAEFIRAGNGAQLMGDARAKLDNMRAREQQLLEERTQRTADASRKTRGAIVLANILTIVSLFLAGLTLTRELKARQLAQDALQKSEEGFRLLVTSVTTYAIFTLDTKGHVESWNAGAERIKGYRQEEILGKHFSAFYPQEDILAGKPELELKTAESEGRAEDEGWRVRKDGSRFWANVVITAMREENGRLIGFSKVSRDLTEHKKAEEDIKDLNRELEQHVVDLIAANRELDAFTYSLAHDLRAPLRHVHGFATILSEMYGDKMDADGKRYLGKVLVSSRDMGVLVDELLAFARLGRAEIAHVHVNLQKIVQEVQQQLEPETQGRTLVWEVGALPKVVGDPALLRQVLTNLLSNAVKYTKKKEAARIEVGSQDDSNEVIVFIRDNGAGFDMKYVQKLFRVFQRLHRADDFEGTGIGLANVRRIIERHEGRVWAEGSPGHGATFYFALPAKETYGEQAGLHSLGG